MRTVAVTAASGPVGRALLERLDVDPQIARIIAVDVQEPPMPLAKLEFRLADPYDPLPPAVLEGADTVVQLAAALDTLPETGGDETSAPRTTQHVLDAAAASGVTTIVHLSSALVYGAHPDNDVPLTEDTPLRANPGFPLAYQQLLAEERVTTFAAEHPDVAVSVLRPVVVLGVGVDTPVSRHLEGVRLPLVRGYEPTVQFVDVDDLAAALHLAVVQRLRGPYNVAAEGWLTAAEVRALLGRRSLAVPEALAYLAAGVLYRLGLLTTPPGALHYLMHPWVVDTARLHAAGWVPRRNQREVLRDFAAAHHGYLTLGRIRARRSAIWTATLALLVAGAGVIASARRRGRPARARRRG